METGYERFYKRQLKIAFVVLMIATLVAFAARCFGQEKPWTDLKIDSVTFAEQYGTVEQYAYQKQIERRSSHKQLCVLVGAKAIWLYNLAYYLGMQDYNVHWNEPDDFNGVIIETTPKIYTTEEPPKITIKAPYNSTLQLTKVTITGPADDVINLFLRYWELSDISLNELKAKKAITKDFGSDRVSFTWLGAQPVITITKNPNAAVDMFKLK